MNPLVVDLRRAERLIDQEGEGIVGNSRYTTPSGREFPAYLLDTDWDHIGQVAEERYILWQPTPRLIQVREWMLPRPI